MPITPETNQEENKKAQKKRMGAIFEKVFNVPKEDLELAKSLNEFRQNEEPSEIDGEIDSRLSTLINETNRDEKSSDNDLPEEKIAVEHSENEQKIEKDTENPTDDNNGNEQIDDYKKLEDETIKKAKSSKLEGSDLAIISALLQREIRDANPEDSELIETYKKRKKRADDIFLNFIMELGPEELTMSSAKLNHIIIEENKKAKPDLEYLEILESKKTQLDQRFQEVRLKTRNPKTEAHEQAFVGKKYE